MDFFTARNTVILALVQEGVITLGVLASGLTFKFYRESHIAVPSKTDLFSVYGPIALVCPLIWVTYAYWTLRREGSTPVARTGAVASGVVLLLLILGIVWYSAVGPLVRFGCGGLAD